MPKLHHPLPVSPVRMTFARIVMDSAEDSVKVLVLEPVSSSDEQTAELTG